VKTVPAVWAAAAQAGKAGLAFQGRAGWVRSVHAIRAWAASQASTAAERACPVAAPEWASSRDVAGVGQVGIQLLGGDRQQRVHRGRVACGPSFVAILATCRHGPLVGMSGMFARGS
jgi:hypothetical protein